MKDFSIDISNLNSSALQELLDFATLNNISLLFIKNKKRLCKEWGTIYLSTQEFQNIIYSSDRTQDHKDEQFFLSIVFNSYLEKELDATFKILFEFLIKL